MKLEVWEDNGHSCQPKGSFPYNPHWWAIQDSGIQNNIDSNISQNKEEALIKANKLYSVLTTERAPDNQVVLGRRLD